MPPCSFRRSLLVSDCSSWFPFYWLLVCCVEDDSVGWLEMVLKVLFVGLLCVVVTGAEGRVNLMVMKVYLKNLVVALESLESLGSSAAEKKEGLERLMPFVSGLGEACVEVGVDQIPTLKKAQAKQSEMDKQTEEAYSRARDLLLLFGTFPFLLFGCRLSHHTNDHLTVPCE